jgi:dipeptidyl aminopeptidase/acylaminoacyl peptidase
MREPQLAWQNNEVPGPWPSLVLSGPPQRTLVRGLRGSFSPDGRQLAYETSESGLIVVLDVRSGRKRVIDTHFSDEPAWSPDGRRLAWRRTFGSFSSERTYIEVRSLDDGSIRRFALRGELELGGWLNDDHILLGSVDHPVVLDLNTGRGSALRTSCSNPKPAPDGRRYTCMLLPDYRLAVGEIGSPQLQVLPLPRGIFANYPAWSPDGQLIAFENQNRRSNYGMYVIQPDGSHLQRVADGFTLFPFWRP